MNNQLWSWILTVVGVTGFILAGRKVWWAWYINIGCQFLWFSYAIVTHQYGFIVASIVYVIVFTQNAIKWTRERNVNTSRIQNLVDTPNYAIHKRHTTKEQLDTLRENYLRVQNTYGDLPVVLEHTKTEDEIYEERLAEWHSHLWTPVYGTTTSKCLECPAIRELTDDTRSPRLD